MAVDKLARRLVPVSLVDRDAVGVDLPVARSAESVPWVVARPDRQSGGPVVPCECVPGPEAADIGCLAEDLRGG
jgi:hypothetical protein